MAPAWMAMPSASRSSKLTSYRNRCPQRGRGQSGHGRKSARRTYPPISMASRGEPSTVTLVRESRSTRTTITSPP